MERSAIRLPNWLWIAATALALAIVAWQVAIAGSWLDEYWQLWISGATGAELPARLVADTHPPWFNLFARAIVLATGGSLVPARLINLFAAIAVLGFGLSRLRGLEAGLRWRMLLLIVASAGAAGMSHLGLSFRAYAWLLALAALQAAMLAALALKRPVPAGLAAIVTAASIAIHYVHAAGAIAIALVSLAVAWRGDRGAFRAILIGLIAGVLLDLTMGLIQLPHWRAIYDVNWIAESGGGGAARSLAAIGAEFLTCNVIAAALLAAGVIAKRSRTVLILLAPIGLAFVGWLILDAAAAAILVPRYMASATSLLTSAAAIAWWELGLAPAVDGALAVLAALQPLATALLRPPVTGWEAGARIAVEVTKACPSAKLYAVSAWQFRPRPDSKAARFENPVIAFGYRKVGRQFGLAPQFVSGPTIVELGNCPSIVWIEAAHGIEQAPPDTILRHAQLRLPAAAKARVVATTNGAVLLISPADRLQPHV